MEQFYEFLAKIGEYFQSLNKADVKEIITSVFWFLVVFAVIQGLRRLNDIREIITEFNKARGPIWDLRGTINEFKELEPVIKQLAEQMSLLDAKVDAARRQVQELQVESFSSRTEEEERPSPLGELPRLGVVAPQPDQWERLRELWRRNADRIESLIEQIPDGRSRLPFDKMRRSDYKAIIDRLEATGRLTASAANASRELVTTFNRYRPRNQIVPASVIGALEVLDQQLDKEISKTLASMAEQAGDSDADSLPPRENAVSQTVQHLN